MKISLILAWTVETFRRDLSGNAVDRRHERPLESEDEKEMVLPTAALETETLGRRGEAMDALELLVCVCAYGAETE